jgi:hypothetical protein
MNATITLTAFQAYPKLQEELMWTQRVSSADIELIWDQICGYQYGNELAPLSYEESSDVLSLLYKLADPDKELDYWELYEQLVMSSYNQQLLREQKKEHKRRILSNKVPKTKSLRSRIRSREALLSFRGFYLWDDVQQMIADGVLSWQTLEGFWEKVEGRRRLMSGTELGPRDPRDPSRSTGSFWTWTSSSCSTDSSTNTLSHRRPGAPLQLKGIPPSLFVLSSAGQFRCPNDP